MDMAVPKVVGSKMLPGSGQGQRNTSLEPFARPVWVCFCVGVSMSAYLHCHETARVKTIGRRPCSVGICF